MATGYIWNTLYGWVDTGTGSLASANLGARLQPISHHLAHPDTKRRFHELVCASGQIDHLSSIQAKPARDKDILRVHTAEHLENMKRVSALPTGGIQVMALPLWGMADLKSPCFLPAARLRWSKKWSAVK